MAGIIMSTTEFFDQKLLNKYNTSGPRYTSYPTALEFNSQFKAAHFKQAVVDSTAKQLSLYVHIPFCHSLCYYCGCNKIITRHREKADDYLEFIAQEIIHKAPLFSHYQVTQLHWGGGTPTFLTKPQITKLVNLLKQHFNFSDEIEMSIEVDPREIPLDLVDHLYQQGFNRLSIGVQDFNPEVQQAINRVQSTEFITQFIHRAKQVGFRSVNIDLIYGLPHQTVDNFSATLAQVKLINPDRISLFNYAHLPNRFAAQRKLKDEWLPSVDVKFALMKLAIETLIDYGYEFIGMDHFAKPDDELAIAQREGKLHRNFQGYTTQGDCDLLGLGVSAISAIGRSFSQNEKELKKYYQAIEQHNDALSVGITLTDDDLIRGEVIKSLMCNLYVDKQAISQQFAIDFDQYFQHDIPLLEPFISDNLIQNTDTAIIVDQKARLLIRNISMTFDAYLKDSVKLQRFSRVI
jgi:oxygen-independent coproporphyrinogen-3 oxidase